MDPFLMIRQPIERSRRDLSIEDDDWIWSYLKILGSTIDKKYQIWKLRVRRTWFRRREILRIRLSRDMTISNLSTKTYCLMMIFWWSSDDLDLAFFQDHWSSKSMIFKINDLFEFLGLSNQDQWSWSKKVQDHFKSRSSQDQDQRSMIFSQPW